jgi:hypothetical protein
MFFIIVVDYIIAFVVIVILFVLTGVIAYYMIFSSILTATNLIVGAC